jgi:hypothetical protein
MPTSGYAAPHLAGLVGSPPGDRGHRDDGQHDGQPPSQHYHQHHQRQHDSAPNATQSQQEPEEGEHCNEQEDFLSHQMQQLLVKDLQSFWSNTVAPSTSSIAQVCVVRRGCGAAAGAAAAATTTPALHAPRTQRCGASCSVACKAEAG